MASDIYQEINWDETIPEWEKRIQENSAANTGNAFLKDLLPFVKKVKPKISKTQSLFGNLTLVCLEGETAYKKDKIIDEGLNPLVKSDILTQPEANKFSAWVILGDQVIKRPSKKFSIDGMQYELSVDNYPESYKDILLRIETGDVGRGKYPRYCLSSGCTGFGRDGNCYSQSKCNWVPNQPEKRGKLNKQKS
jgi:hypothetical protein